MRRRIHYLLFSHGSKVLPGGQRIPQAHRQSATDTGHSVGVDCEQVRLAEPKDSVNGGGTVSGKRIRMPILWDIRLFATLHRWRVLHTGAGDTEEAGVQEGEWMENFIEFVDNSFILYVSLQDSDSLSHSPSSISIEKIEKKRSRWWRIRSILTLVFRRKRHLN